MKVYVVCSRYLLGSIEVEEIFDSEDKAEKFADTLQSVNDDVEESIWIETWEVL